MNISVYLPFLASLAIGVVGPTFARRARPAVGALMLSTVAMIAAIGSMWALTLLAITGVDDVPAWNPKAITFPVPDPIAAIAGVGAATALVRIAMTLYRRQRVHRRVRDALMHIESGDPDVV